MPGDEAHRQLNAGIVPATHLPAQAAAKRHKACMAHGIAPEYTTYLPFYAQCGSMALETGLDSCPSTNGDVTRPRTKASEGQTAPYPLKVWPLRSGGGCLAGATPLRPRASSSTGALVVHPMPQRLQCPQAAVLRLRDGLGAARLVQWPAAGCTDKCLRPCSMKGRKGRQVLRPSWQEPGRAVLLVEHFACHATTA